MRVFQVALTAGFTILFAGLASAQAAPPPRPEVLDQPTLQFVPPQQQTSQYQPPSQQPQQFIPPATAQPVLPPGSSSAPSAIHQALPGTFQPPPPTSASMTPPPPPDFPGSAPPDISPNAEQWRYVYQNGQWWYYMPTKRWMVWTDGRWLEHAPVAAGAIPQAVQPAPVYTTPAYAQPAPVYVPPRVTVGVAPYPYPYGPYPYGPYPYGYYPYGGVRFGYYGGYRHGPAFSIGVF